MAEDRVEVPVWEYLHNEAQHLASVKQQVAKGFMPHDHAFEILFDSYMQLLTILSQQQKARDENG